MRQFALLLWGAVCAVTASLAAEQAYPTKPIRVLVPFAPGGGADLIARLVAPRLSERLGQPVVVDNRPTASGTLATELAARATPDGHTLLVPTSNHIANPSLYKLNYDTINDFAPITLAVISPLVLVVHPSLPVNTVQEFIAHAKSNPDKLNYGAAGAGGPPHLAGELLKSMAGIRMTPIMYKGIGPAVIAALGNESRVGQDDVGARLAALVEGDAQVDHHPGVLTGPTVAVEAEIHADIDNCLKGEDGEN